MTNVSLPLLARRNFLGASFGLAGSTALPGFAMAQDKCETPLIINPLIFQRADPWVLRDEDSYYFTASVPEYDRIILRKANSIAALSNAAEIVLWHRPPSGKMAGHIWAPEIHRVNGKWYVYFAAGDGDDVFRIRTYVLTCEGDDPMANRWSVLGQLQTAWDTFTLDCTAFEHRGVNYLCWAQQEPGIETNSNLYLAPIETPTTLAAPQIRLTIPTLPWEIQGFKVNEGAAFLAHNDKVFLTYSASATDDRYAMGLLWAKADADLMNPASWSKSQEPIFVSEPKRCIYGPGHNSFTTDTCGRQILVYHARNYKDIVGDPLYDPNRHARVQQILFDKNGFPVFGKPVPNGPLRLTGV